MTNRYPGTCKHCRKNVPAGAGHAVKKDGRWGVLCEGCGEKAGLKKEPERPVDERRLIEADGTIRIPFSRDEGQKSLLRSLPPPAGQRSGWDPDKKVWRASIAQADVKRSLEIARTLGLEIAPELLKLEGERTEEAVEADKIDGLYAFQPEGVEFLASGSNRLLADEMGCVDGEAEVRLNRAGKGFAMSLGDLYHRFNGGRITGGKYWDRSIPTYIRSLCDGDLRLNQIRKVLNKGVREVVKITLKSGKTLRLTPDHEVRLSSGKWIEAQRLRSGSVVTVNGQTVCKSCGKKGPVITYPYAKFVGHCRTCMYRKLRAKPTYKTGKCFDKSGYVLVSGQWEHPRCDRHGRVPEHILVMEKNIGRFMRRNEVAHHQDNNPSNNAISNLQLMTTKEHNKLHGSKEKYRHMDGGVTGKGGKVCFIPITDTVLSVRKDGTAHVYDVVCADPHRNFIANGIVVHNCGKTIETLCALPRSGDLPPVMCIVPNCVKYNWRDEAAIWAPHYKVTCLRTKQSFRWPERGEMVMISYELLPKEAAYPSKKEKGKGLLAHLQFSKSAPKDLVTVIDECHNLRNNSLRKKRCTGIVKASARAWGLTGTPLLNHPDQLWRVLDSLSLAKIAFGSWNNFTRLFNATQNRWGGWEWGMPKPEVPERLRRVMLRRLKANVLPDLPPKRSQKLVSKGEDKALTAELDRLWDEWEETIVEGALPPFELFSKVRMQLAQSRIPDVLEWIEPYEDSKTPVIVFSAHREVIDTLEKRDGWETITGSTPSKKRSEIVKDFQAGKLKGIGATILAAGVGITLTKASTALFVDLDWTPAMNVQAQDRLHRIGQTADSVLYVRMVSDHPLDQHIQSLIAKKMELIDRAIERRVTVDPETLKDETSRRKAREERQKQQAAAAREAEEAEARERCQSITKRQREKLGENAPELDLTTERVEAISDALSDMLSVCDGATTKDGMGFNKPDAVRSRWLSVLTLADEDAQRCALSMLQGYSRQLKGRYPILWN